jgi:hypothetical protein
LVPCGPSAGDRRRRSFVAIVHVERITCDNPECISYVDELMREEPGQFELQEYVRTLVSQKGWTSQGGLDFCPAHALG